MTHPGRGNPGARRADGKLAAYLTIAGAYAVGGSSLLLLGAFLIRGPLDVVDLQLSVSATLGFNTMLCLAFFAQHSVMIRRPVQDRIARWVPDRYLGATFAIASGILLLALVLLWQALPIVLWSAQGLLRGCLRALSAVAVLGVAWGALALGAFDPFGIRPIRAALRSQAISSPPLAIRGPYCWVRHPLYSSVLLLIWSAPELTADRLLLNILWTAWVIIGTLLEERDLVSAFGDPYRDYQKRVPMLIPWRFGKTG